MEEHERGYNSTRGEEEMGFEELRNYPNFPKLPKSPNLHLLPCLLLISQPLSIEWRGDWWGSPTSIVMRT